MKKIANIILILSALLTLSHNAVAGSTVQVRDIVIIDKVEHKANKPLILQIDSVSYISLKEKLDFNSSTLSWNFRGHVATFEVKGNKLYLNSIETSKKHTDFKGSLDKYMDKKGKVFASWISGKVICGAGECLYVAPNGFDSVYEQETELVVENGVIVSSRTYSNKAYGTLYLDDAKDKISQEINLSKIKAPKGRVTVKINASKFTDKGKVAKWSVEFLRGHEGLSADIKGQIITEINRVFNLVDWRTYYRDGEWHWTIQNGVTYPLIFNTI